MSKNLSWAILCAKINGFLDKTWVQRLIKTGPYTVFVIVFVAIWNYFPEQLMKLPSSKYAIAAITAIAAASIVFNIKRHKDEEVSLSTRTLPLSPYTATQCELRRGFVNDTARDIYGWPHYLGEREDVQYVSALSTAYGLKTHMLLSFETPDISVKLCQKWLREVSKEGGWNAQSQGDLSRAEVTAVIAGTLAKMEGQSPAVNKAKIFIEASVTNKTDPLLQTNTYVVSLVIEESPYLEISQIILNSLIDRLIDGAVPSNDKKFYWTETLVHADKANSSPAMTANAILALQSLIRNGHTISQVRLSVLDGALDWLSEISEFSNQTTSLTRYNEHGHQEQNAPRHFTAALIAVALLQSGRDYSHEQKNSIRHCMKSYRDGLWYWDNGDAPVWMTYYGVMAVTQWKGNRNR